MAPRRIGPGGMGKASRRMWFFAGGVVVLSGVLILAFAIHLGMIQSLTYFGSPSSGQSPTSPGGSAQGQLSAAECAAQESNASLTQIIVHLYQGNGNSSGSGSGLIYQGPPGASAYPSESVAGLNVINGWQSVCESAPYYSLVQQWGAPSYPVNALAQNQTGVYELVVAVTWAASATSCSQAWNGDCMGSAQWLINVASGAVTGPTTSFFSPQPAA